MIQPLFQKIRHLLKWKKKEILRIMFCWNLEIAVKEQLFIFTHIPCHNNVDKCWMLQSTNWRVTAFISVDKKERKNESDKIN